MLFFLESIKKKYVLNHRAHNNFFKELRVWFFLLNTEYICRRNNDSNFPMIYDQGPLFSIVWLKLFGKGTSFTFLRKIIDNLLNRVLSHLNIIIYLDITNESLLNRITKRGTKHDLLFLDEIDLMNFISDYKKEFKSVVTKAKEKRVLIIDINTSNKDLGLILEEIFLKIEKYNY